MTAYERQQLIKLGILTPDCDPNITTSRKVSPERKREVRRWVKEREAMAGPLLTTILERLNTVHQRLTEWRNRITEEERQQLLMGLEKWQLELKSELTRRANERKTFFGGRAGPGLLAGIVDRLKRPR
jgi:hypothetical protein